MENWEVSASEAKRITESAPIVKLNRAKERIMQEIKKNAMNGNNDIVIYLDYYDVSCLEDWSNIYNWLLNLGYEIQDNSGSKFKPTFWVKW